MADRDIIKWEARKVKFEDMRIKDIRCVVRYMPKQTHWRAHGRKDHIVGIKLGGSALHDFGYKSFDLNENCAFFFNQRDDYEVEVKENGWSLSIHFTTNEDIETDSFCITPAGSGELLGILEKTEIQSKTHGLNDLMTMSLVYRFCAELCRQREKQYAPRDVRMTEARRYMDTHFRERECLSNAVALSKITSRRFGELFKTNFGTTPNRYLILKKVEFAKELLGSGSFSVSETAELCGFCDVYYFSRVFKTETGVPPRDWI